MPTLETLVIKLETQTSGMSKGLKMAGAAIASLGVAAIAFGEKSLQAFEPLDKATKRLGEGLGKIGETPEMGQVMDWAKHFSIETGINEAGIVDMASKLETMGSAFFKAAGPKAGEALSALTGDLEDMSAATGKTTGMLMRSLGPAILNAPQTAITLLVKYGVLTDEQAVKVQKLVDAGKKQAATLLEINAAQAAYGGEAAAIATPLEKLSNLWNQLEVTVGKFISEGLAKLMEWAPKVLEWLKNTWDAIQPVVTVFAGPFLNALKSLWQALSPLIDALKKLWDAFGPILKIVAVVGMGILLLQVLILGFIAEVVGKVILFAAKFIDAFASIVDFVKDRFVEPIVSKVMTIWDHMKTVADLIKGAFVDAWQFILGPIKAVFDKIHQWIDDLIGWVQDAINILEKLNPFAQSSTPQFHTAGINARGTASGGIVTSPQVRLVGEAGPEAIIPLSSGMGLGGVTVNIYGDVTGEEIVRKVRDGLLKLGARNGTTGL